MGNCSHGLRSVSTYGPRPRSAFVRDAVLAAVERQRRAIRLRAAAGILRASQHDWDDDPVAWVSRQRSGDPRRSP